MRTIIIFSLVFMAAVLPGLVLAQDVPVTVGGIHVSVPEARFRALLAGLDGPSRQRLETGKARARMETACNSVAQKAARINSLRDYLAAEDFAAIAAALDVGIAAGEAERDRRSSEPPTPVVTR